MSDLAKIKDTTVSQAVGDPSTEACVGLRSVNTTDRRVLLPTNNLNGPEDTPEGPSDPVGLDHFVRLAGVGRIKGGDCYAAPTLYTAKITRKITKPLFTNFVLNNVLPPAEIFDSKARCHHPHAI